MVFLSMVTLSMVTLSMVFTKRPERLWRELSTKEYPLASEIPLRSAQLRNTLQ